MKDDNIKKLIKTLNERQKDLIPKSTAWVIVEKVDWDAKTMTAKGVSDGLEYFDILLGIGNDYKKPKIATKCLIGTVEGLDAAAYLICAEDVEEALVTVGDALLTIKPSGFKIEVGGVDFGKTMSALLKAMKALTVTTGVGPSGTPINIADFEKVETDLKSILI